MSSSPAHSFEQEVCLASAGTGKTWSLSERFLGILAAGADPGEVLATTFTRKAAGEILNRVLRRLVDGAAGTDRPAGLDAGACLRLLAHLARDLDRFQVRTLDSFFADLLRLQPLAAALAPDWRILDPVEEAVLRADAVDRALTAAGPKLDREFLRDLHQGELPRSVHRGLLEAVAAAWEIWLDAPPEAWEFPAEPPPPQKPVAELRAAIGTLAPPLTRAGHPNKPWQKALAGLAELLAMEPPPWLDLLKLGFVQKILDQGSYSRHPAPPLLAASLQDLVAHAANQLLVAVRKRNAAMARFLAAYAREHERLLRATGGLGFADLPRLLEALEPPDEELAFRRGAGIRHLLLDEFQDTSVRQWRILHPLIEELRGRTERAFFCVGDPKQSIFGWREGEPRLLRGLAKEFPARSLQVSWRSAPLILDTVNRIFTALPERDAPLAEIVSAWRTDWPRHEAARPNRSLSGRAAVHVAPEPESDEEKAEDVQIRALLDLVARRHAEAPGATIGVLLRRNKWIPRLLLGLQDRGIAASGEGGNPLVDAPAVAALISLLWLADHPGDSAAAFHVASSFLGPLLDLSPDREAERSWRRARGQLARTVRRRLAAEGYAAFLASFGAAVAAGGSNWDRRRYARLLDLAAAWDRQGGGNRPAAFVEWVRRTPVEDPERAQVRVLTIHKAKGLEYDAVVLGDLDGNLFQRAPAVLARRQGVDGPVERASVAGNATLRALDAEWAELYDAWRARQFDEGLCLLYVALTRARRSLDVVLGPAGRGENLGDVLLDALGAAREPGTTAWQHPEGSAHWAGDLPPAPASSPAGPPSPAPIALAPPRGERRLLRRAPSAARGHIHTASLFRAGGAAGRERGLLVHRWLQEIEWLEDFAAGDEALLAAAAELGLREVDPAALLPAFRRLLDREEVRAVLCRERWPHATGEEVRVQREREFLLRLEAEGGPHLARGAFDRLVVHYRQGRPAAAHVLDWKCEEGGTAELEARYAGQLAAYRVAAASILQLPERAVRTRIVPVPLAD